MESTDYLSRYEEDENGCWNYTGTVNKKGYGQIRQTTAHRFFWQLLRGPIPEGLHLDHLCFNTRCVNPDHLEPVTPSENSKRQADRNHPWMRFWIDGRRIADVAAENRAKWDAEKAS